MKGDWKPFYDDGAAYCNRAVAGARTGGYTPEVIHGLVSMGAEKLLMALLVSRGKLPEGHTFTELVSAVSGICEIDSALRKTLIGIDEMIPLCSLDPARSWKVPPSLIPDLTRAAIQVRAVVDKALAENRSQ
jgi:hypothetical protein